MTQTFTISDSSGSVLYQGQGSSFSKVLQSAVEKDVNLAGAKLTGARLAGAKLTGARLAGAKLTGADLTGADLTGAKLAWADLTGAKLAWADLTGARLAGASLAGADLAGADLTGADLTGADLTGARLTGADLTGGRVAAERTISHRYGCLALGPLGSRHDVLLAFVTDPGVWVTTGCFAGSLGDFADAVVERHGANRYAIQYLAAVKMLEAWAESLKVEV